MRTAIIFIILMIFSFVVNGLGWQEVEIDTYSGMLMAIGIMIGIVMSIIQDIKELKS